MAIPGAAEEIVARATAEHDAGRQRFITGLRFLRKRDFPACAATVEAVEDVGWVMDQFSVASGQGSAEYGYFLFKRR